MKKIKILFYILFLFLLVLTLTGCSSKNTNNNEKAVSEVKYLESKLTSLLNSMNNIKYENYNVITGKIEENSSSESSQSSSKSDSNSSNSSNSDNSSKESGKNGSDSQSSNDQDENDKKKYTLEKTSILTNSSDTIDWKTIKNEVEIMYSAVPTITLDLYSLNTNQNEILSFNNELDNLTVAVKEENKEDTFKRLSNLYNYLPKYLDSVSTDENYKNIVKCKSNVINAYSLIDTGNWNQVSEYIKIAIEDYSNILNNITENSKTYNINRGYILLNELQNAANMHDKEIFLIKYRNLLEEFNSI